MAKGSEIVLASNPRGVFMEGYIAEGETPKPGTIMQIDPSAPHIGGRQVWETYDRAADGASPSGPLAVLNLDYLQGRDEHTAYAAGERCFLYIPYAGEELNLLVADVPGTADTHTAGQVYIVEDGTGKLIKTTGTPEAESFILMEDLPALTGDTLAWVIYRGH